MQSCVHLDVVRACWSSYGLDSCPMILYSHHSNFPELESGRAYRFKVRAVNYCSAVDTGSICYGDFSESAAYTVR